MSTKTLTKGLHTYTIEWAVYPEDSCAEISWKFNGYLCQIRCLTKVQVEEFVKWGIENGFDYS